MAPEFSLESTLLRLKGLWRGGALSLKATSFAAIGLINTAIDYGIFLMARWVLQGSPQAVALFAALSALCRCGAPQALLLTAANIVSWAVAVSGSYVLNASITFAAESGRKLTLRAYVVFVAAGIAGLIANTATLLFAAQVLVWPVWIAKALAIMASFIVNFTLSHFYVFRVRRGAAADVGGQR